MSSPRWGTDVTTRVAWHRAYQLVRVASHHKTNYPPHVRHSIGRWWQRAQVCYDKRNLPTGYDRARLVARFKVTGLDSEREYVRGFGPRPGSLP